MFNSRGLKHRVATLETELAAPKTQRATMQHEMLSLTLDRAMNIIAASTKALQLLGGI